MSWTRSIVAAFAALVLVSAPTGCGGKRAPMGPADTMIARAATINSRGVRAYSSGRYERAAGLFAESLAINRSLDNRAGEVIDLVNLARTYASMDDIPSARGYLDEAGELAGRIGDTRIVSAVSATYARVEHMAGDREAALKRLERSLELDSEAGVRDIGGKLNLKGALLKDGGDPEGARAVLKRARKLNAEFGHRTEEANSLRELAAMELEAGRLDEAKALLSGAYEIDRAEANPARIAADLERMAGVELAAGNTREAVFLLERSVQVNLSAGLGDRALATMDRVISLLEDSGDTEAAKRYTSRKDTIVKMLQERKP